MIYMIFVPFLPLYHLIVNDDRTSTAESEKKVSMQSREPTMNESRLVFRQVVIASKSLENPSQEL